MTWRGIKRAIHAVTESKYKEPKHLAKENVSENELEVEVNQKKVSSVGKVSLSVGTKNLPGICTQKVGNKSNYFKA